jgi:RNA polymerase sigma-70 factor (ECF subfamily)
VSQTKPERRFTVVNVDAGTLDGMATSETTVDFDALFHAHYGRIARVIGRVVRDPARAEDLAVEVFWKWWRNADAQGNHAGAWLYRTAVRMALDELRRRSRRTHYESAAIRSPESLSPEVAHAAAKEQQQVRLVLAALKPRHAEILLLRSHGLSYEDLANSLELNPASPGNFVTRAQQAFRKEYVKQYGEPRNER